MSPGDRRYTVEWIRAGQSRAYADSCYEFIIRVEWIPYGSKTNSFEPNDLDESLIKNAARAIGHWFPKEGDKTDWASTELKSFEKLSPGVWRCLVIEPYTD